MNALYKQEPDAPEDIAYPHEGAVQFVAVPPAVHASTAVCHERIGRTLYFPHEGGGTHIES